MAVAFDEMTGADGGLRPAYRELARWLEQVPADALEFRRREAEVLFRRIGITFAVYGEAEGQERLIPFDVLRASSRPPNGSWSARDWSSASMPSTGSLPISMAAGRSSRPASSPRTSYSRTRYSGRK